jgi:hypothetical protein
VLDAFFGMIRVLIYKTFTMATASKKASGKRTTIAPNGDKRYVRRDEKGQFKESDDAGKSLSTDARQHAKTKSKPGFGDKGDR